MMARCLQYSNIRILLLIFVWLLTGAAAVADSLDLADDIGIPISQSLQAISVDLADEVKQGVSLARSPTSVLSSLSDLVHVHLQAFTVVLRLFHTHPSTLRTPLYESLCTYRL